MIDERKEKIFSSNRPRFVSGGMDRDFSNTSTYGDEDSTTTVSNLYTDTQDYYGDPQVQYRESWSNDNVTQQLEVPLSNFDQESYISTTALPSPAYPTPHHYVQPPFSYPWPTYSNPYYAGYAPAPAATTHYNSAQAQAQAQVYAAVQARVPMITPSYVNDPAAVSYAYQQQQQQQQYQQHLHNQYHQVEDESESFQTAYEGEETEEEELQQGGFFFPAVAPQPRGQYRRDSTSSVTTTVPQMIISTPRKRSIVSPAKVGFESYHYHQERRNSASATVPSLQRRKSIPNPPVTVSPPRRFSIATPLNHSNQHQHHRSETKILRQPRNPHPPLPPQSPPLTPLPPTPNTHHINMNSNSQQTLVPHRNRPQSTSSVNVAQQSGMKSHSRTNSKSASTQSQHHQTHISKVSASTSKESAERSGNSSGDWGGKDFVEENSSVIEEVQEKSAVGNVNATGSGSHNTWYRGRGRGRRGRGRGNEKVDTKAV